MTYSSTAIVALLVHCIVNFDALIGRQFRNDTPAGKSYRWLILSDVVFYIFDAFWGVFYDAQMMAAVYADTVLYFLAMTATLFLWTRYVINYLQATGWLVAALKHVGTLYLVFVAAVLILNFFLPVMFWFDESVVYHSADLRYAILAVQVILFLASACYALFTARGKHQSAKRHHWAIGVYGITMTTTIIIQVFNPLLPLYSIGCLLGACILHTFILGDLMEERRLELEEMVRREEEHKKELGFAKQMAFRDSLTGVKSKHAYMDWEERINERIKTGEQESFAVVVCDINDLKKVNDLYGHHEGDACIKRTCARICAVYSHSPVFRIGGDEFVALLSGQDYIHRYDLMEQISAIPQDQTKVQAGGTIAAGMAEYDEAQHTCLLNVFEEADRAMYKQKQFMKESLLQ